MESLPNQLTVARLIAVPLFIATFFMQDVHLGNILALTIFIIASLTDFFDGFLARALDAESKFGTMLDPIADKLLVVAVLVVLVFDRQENTLPRVDIIPALIIILREIFVSGMREFLASEQVKMPVTKLAKWKTAIQFLALTFVMAAPVIASETATLQQLGNALLWLAAVLTFITGFQYYRHTMGYIRLAGRE